MKYFDTSNGHIHGPRTGPWRHAWWFRADGEHIGEIRETQTGYEGELHGQPPVFVPEMPFRSAVLENLIRQALIREAGKHDIKLLPADITGVESGYPEIDGMPAYQWLYDMTMD